MIAHTLLEDRPALTNYQPLVDVEDGQALAQAIVEESVGRCAPAKGLSDLA